MVLENSCLFVLDYRRNKVLIKQTEQLILIKIMRKILWACHEKTEVNLTIIGKLKGQKKKKSRVKLNVKIYLCGKENTTSQLMNAGSCTKYTRIIANGQQRKT